MRKNAAKLLSLLLSLALMVSCLCAPGFAIKADVVSQDRFGVRKASATGTMAEENYDWYDIYDAQGNLLYWEVGDFEFEPTDHPITPAELAQIAQQRQSELEGKYACRIQWDGDYTALGKIYTLKNLEAEFQAIPAPLLEATTRAIRNQMGAFTLQFIDEGDWSVPHGIASGNASSAKIQLYNGAYLFVHEYGHLVHLSLLDARYGANTLQNMWTAQNGGAVYGDYDYENPAFVTAYAATNYREDFADTFAYIMGDGSSGMVLTYEAPNSIAVKKMAYLRQLLSEAFGVSVSIFPSTDPSRPSSWAQAGVQEYLDIFYSGPLADREVFYPGYQSGATRLAFANAAYQNVVTQINRDIPWEDRDARNAFNEKWHVTEYYDTLRAEYDFPFTDVSGSSAILVLYLNGVVKGTGDGTTFSPEATITRQEAATMLYRLCNALGYQFPEQSVTFADNDAIADWAREAVGAVAAAGIMNGVGDNRFDPTTLYTYEQSALTMVRVYKLLSGK